MADILRKLTPEEIKRREAVMRQTPEERRAASVTQNYNALHSSSPQQIDAELASYEASSNAFDNGIDASGDILRKKSEADQIAKDNADAAAKNKAMGVESAAASVVAAKNRGEVSDKLKQRLTTPLQQTPQVSAIPYVSGGYNPTATKQNQAAQMGSAVPPAPAASQGMAIAAKINSDAGGTNAVQNKYTMPNISGLSFGGT